jgi:hypothetical protein
MMTLKKALATSAVALALGLGASVANAATVLNGPLNCPVDTSLTSGKLAATCVTYAYYNPEDAPATDTLAKVQAAYGDVDSFYDKDEGGNDSGTGDGAFYLTGENFAPIDYGNTTSGYFLLSNSLLSSFDTFILALKGGNTVPTWVMFEIQVSSLIAGMGNQAGFSYGTWSSGRQGLSHASLYVGGEGDTDVPEPGSLALLGLGLMGLGMVRRRKTA